MRKIFSFVLFIFLTLSPFVYAQSPGEIEIIFDASRSMNEPMGTATKLVEAKSALQHISEKIDPESRVGLRVFGANLVRGTIQEACLDSQLVIPIRPYDKAGMLQSVVQLAANGQTSLGYSLEQSVKDFTQNPDISKTIILVSDGEESCGKDPVAIIKTLQSQGVQIVVHAIGFNVGSEARQQLEQIAQLTGGIYADAKNAKELEARLAEVGEKAMLIQPRKSYGEKNVISPANGAKIVVSSVPLFAQLVDGKEDEVGAFYAGQEVVFQLPEGKPYLLESFSIPIFKTTGINISSLSFYGSLIGPEKEYFHLGTFKIKNKLSFENVYQEYRFDPPMPARWLKVVLGVSQDNSNRSYMHEWKIKGKSMGEEELQKFLGEHGEPRMDLLEPGNGGKLLAAEHPKFGKFMDGRYDADGDWFSFNAPTEGIISFGGRTAVIEKVAVDIPEKDNRNIKTVEILVSQTAPTGPYEPAGSVQTMNMVFAGNPFQEFPLAKPARAKFVKIRLVNCFEGTRCFAHELKLKGYIE